jgi:methionyl-tRNA formyltransferase
VKVLVLTTQTPHHAFFIRELAAAHEVIAFRETTSLPAPFDTHHPFEDERDRYEWNRWFAGRRTDLTELVLKKQHADAVVVFGTGVLKAPVIEDYSQRIFNLHGGDPQEYRGLDTHLWAIFHRDFAGLVTTLHRLDTGLDTGDIVASAAVPVTSAMPLHALRAANTEQCVALVNRALEAVARDGDVASHRQQRKGRYYSAMPAVLKSVCQARFNAYVARLGHAAR